MVTHASGDADTILTDAIVEVRIREAGRLKSFRKKQNLEARNLG